MVGKVSWKMWYLKEGQRFREVGNDQVKEKKVSKSWDVPWQSFFWKRELILGGEKKILNWTKSIKPVLFLKGQLGIHELPIYVV